MSSSRKQIEIDRIDWKNRENSTEQNEFIESIEFIEQFSVANLSYDEFFWKFMMKNVPVIINGIADRWDCSKWTKNGDSLDFDYLRQRINCSLHVPVANCDKTYYNAHEKIDLTFDKFLSYWHDRINNVIGQENQILYLKDWHLRREQPDYEFYETPLYFASDWLNEYCIETNSDDYRFVYMGPKGTW